MMTASFHLPFVHAWGCSSPEQRLGVHVGGDFHSLLLSGQISPEEYDDDDD